MAMAVVNYVTRRSLWIFVGPKKVVHFKILFDIIFHTRTLVVFVVLVEDYP